MKSIEPWGSRGDEHGPYVKTRLHDRTTLFIGVLNHRRFNRVVRSEIFWLLGITQDVEYIKDKRYNGKTIIPTVYHLENSKKWVEREHGWVNVRTVG